jgi:mRNA-degrading endonuclease RelE of RelBE toxin-antitoxin system
MAFEIVPIQEDPTIDVGTEMRTYKPSEIGEQSDRYDRLKVYFDSLREKLQLVGVLIQKPEEKIQDFYDDFENYDDNIISYFTYVKEMLEPKFNELKQLPRKNRNSFDEQSYKVIQNLLNFEINAKQKQFLSEEFKNPFERFQKELTMFKPSEELSPEKATEFFRNYIANFVENLISLTPERFQERGLNKDPNLPKLQKSMKPQQSQQLVAFTEKFITQIKKLAEENPSMFRKYLEYVGNPGEQLEKLKRSKESTEEAPEEITEASTQNIQKKVTSKVLDEMIKKYASKR